MYIAYNQLNSQLLIVNLDWFCPFLLDALFSAILVFFSAPVDQRVTMWRPENGVLITPWLMACLTFVHLCRGHCTLVPSTLYIFCIRTVSAAGRIDRTSEWFSVRQKWTELVVFLLCVLPFPLCSWATQQLFVDTHGVSGGRPGSPWNKWEQLESC